MVGLVRYQMKAYETRIWLVWSHLETLLNNGLLAREQWCESLDEAETLVGSARH